MHLSQGDLADKLEVSRQSVSKWETDASVPELDKLVRLMGAFTVRCEDPAVEQELARFLRRVETGAGRQGLRGFLESYLSDLLTYGGAVGEMLPAPDGRGLAAVVNCPGEAVTVRPAEDGPGLRFYAGPDGLPGREVPYPELILFTPLDPAAGEVWGRSLLEGLEGPAAVLETIFRSMRANFERAGSLRYAVTYRPAAGDPTDPEEAARFVAETR